MWCWGGNSHGELCLGAPGPEESSAVRTKLTDVVEVALGSFHTCARHRDGSVSCCGDDRFGTLGDGDVDSTGRIVQTLSSGAMALGGSDDATCALGESGVTCWGHLLVDGVHRPIKTLIANTAGASAVDMTVSFGCVLVKGSPLCWGANDLGQLGYGGAATSAPVPTRPALGITDAVSITVGTDFACVLRSSGETRCWGSNQVGQLGATVGSPAIVTGATAVSAGSAHVCAETKAGDTLCWGQNDHEQLGVPGDRTNRDTPIRARFKGQSIACGNASCCGLVDGVPACWGRIHGVSGEPRAVPIGE